MNLGVGVLLGDAGGEVAVVGVRLRGLGMCEKMCYLFGTKCCLAQVCRLTILLKI